MISTLHLRKDFPILRQRNHGHRLVYLDNTNTSLTPVPVVKAMDEYYTNYKANIHRALYPLSEKATEAYEGAREKVRRFIGAQETKEIVFTRNATESINLVAKTWGKENLHQGDTLVLSIMEHHSNIVPWQILQKDNHFHIYFVSLTAERRLDMIELKKVLKGKRVKLVAITHQSNVLGVVNPVKEIVELSHQSGAKVLIDGAQSVPHQKVDMNDFKPDFFVFTGHKMCGPTGIGALYVKKEILEDMPPFLGGGDMIRTVEMTGATWNEIPYKFEAGTPNIAGAIGLGAAIDYLEKVGMREIAKIEKKLTVKALQVLREIPGLKVLGSTSSEKRGPLFSFIIPGIHPHDIATFLGERGLCIRSGNHCAQPLMDYLNVPASARISLSFYNTEKDLEDFAKGVKALQRLFNRTS